jgi:hypothetical protein
MSKALLIGINYIGTPNQLQGCIYDVIEMKSLLIDAYGFSPSNIITLRDDDPANSPTRARILQEIQALLASPGQIFLHYSGHGTQIKDTTADESDRLDECIVPCDYAKSGFITDEQINVLAKGLKGKGLALFDTCRSGTIMDLPYTGITTTAATEGFYCFSGCQDNQDAAEAVTGFQGSNTGLPQGAMTMAFISTIRSLNYYPTISSLYTAVLANLKTGGYSQIPQLTSNVTVGPQTPFPFSSPIQQLSQQQGLTSSLQAQVQQLQTQLQQALALAALVPNLQTQVQTLASVQSQLQTLLTQDIANQALIADLKKQTLSLPALKDQAALAASLQAQVSHLPGLQQQIATLMSQLQSGKALQAQILSLQQQLKQKV